MDELPWVSPEKLKIQLRGMADELAEQIMQSLNAARVGHLIDDADEPVREVGREFVRAAFEAALQQKIDAAEASFSPSEVDESRSGDAATGDPAAAQQGEAGAERVDGAGTGEGGAPLVARARSRQRGAGR